MRAIETIFAPIFASAISVTTQAREGIENSAIDDNSLANDWHLVPVPGKKQAKERSRRQ